MIRTHPGILIEKMQQHNRFRIFTVFMSLWIVVIAHEAIPHYHPPGNGMITQLLMELPGNTETPVNDENGILDNLIVLHKKKSIEITPNYSCIVSDCYHQFQFWSARFLLVYLINNRNVNSLSLQQQKWNADVQFRGPPNLI